MTVRVIIFIIIGQQATLNLILAIEEKIEDNSRADGVNR